jgi:hypothetical protein
MKLMKLKIFNEEKKQNKKRSYVLVVRRIGGRCDFVFVLLVVVLLVHDISKRKKVTPTECLHRDVRLVMKPFSYDVT